jgi:UDP:flavonoid glycosyltransferase YjiC (YdhE family)
VLGLFPDWFGDPQPDWPSQLQCTGFVLSDEYCAPDEAQPAAPTVLPSSTGVLPSSTEYRVPSTEEYLSSGDAPIVFTPGSANRHASQFFRAAIDATARIGRRALLVTSYSDHLPPSLPEHAHHVTYASFATLFPQAAAVVHHGGIGTSAQALAAGVPQLVMPMGFDQPDNAVRLRALGVAETILPGRFTAPRVASALERLLTADDVSAACRRCRERFDGAKAVERVCDLIEEQHRLFTGRIGDMA